MNVTLLYVDGCQGMELARKRLIEASHRVGFDEQTVVYQAVSTQEDAQRLGFKGSPTILVNGQDPFPGGESGSGLTCRLYAGASGGDQAPSVEQLVAALQHR